MTEIAFSEDDRIRKELCSAWAAKKAPRGFLLYGWLSFCDYDIAGRTLKLDFSRYDVVLRTAENHSLDKLFTAIVKNDCSEVAEKAGALTIEIIEKEAG